MKTIMMEPEMDGQTKKRFILAEVVTECQFERTLIVWDLEMSFVSEGVWSLELSGIVLEQQKDKRRTSSKLTESDTSPTGWWMRCDLPAVEWKAQACCGWTLQDWSGSPHTNPECLLRSSKGLHHQFSNASNVQRRWSAAKQPLRFQTDF